MISHGFNSEIAQNKSLSTVFDSNSANNSPKSNQKSIPSSNQSNSTENALTKKVNSLVFFKNIFLFIKTCITEFNIRRKRANDASK